MKRNVLLIVVLALCLCAVGWTFEQRKATPPRAVQWEYTAYTGKDLDQLNRLGAEGWELVSVDVPTAVFFFKRPK